MEDLIYTYLIARFRANEACFAENKLKPIAHFDLFRNQYVYPELHHLYKKPAIFFEFGTDWSDKDDLVQTGQVIMRAHIELENYGASFERSKNRDYALEIFSYHRLINALIHGFKSKYFSSIRRRRDEPDQQPTNTNVKIITYQTFIDDDSALQIQQSGIIREPLDELDAKKEVIEEVPKEETRYVID